MALQPHVNGEAAVMLVVVGDVVQQHGAADVSVDPLPTACPEAGWGRLPAACQSFWPAQLT